MGQNGEAPGGLSHHALEVGHNGVGVAEILALGADVLGGQVVLDHEDGQIAHHFGGGGHLDDAAQHIVDLLVHLLDLVEAAAQTKGDDLRLQVGVLAAGDLIAVDVGDGALQTVVEVLVAQTHVSPVVGQLLQLGELQTGVPLGAFQRGDHSVHGGLAGQGGHGGDGGVHNVHTGFGGHQQGGDLVGGGVVGVQVDRQADLLLPGGDQLLGRIGLEQTGHILDSQQVSAALLQLLCYVDIILERVTVMGGIQNVAGVAHGGLAQLALLQHLVHGDLHAGDPVQGIEHAEYVDAGLCGLLDEGADQVIGVVGIAHGVGAAQQHLERWCR